jgi:hypothetical protein
MTDLLEQGAAWLDGKRHSYLTRTVTYQRGEFSVQVQATVGQTVFRIDDGYGGWVRVTQRDYLIRAADLVIDGQITLPLRGDKIIETQGDNERDPGGRLIYEVMGPGGNEPDWRFSGPSRRTLRIHTKHVATEDA